jgi:glyoxylase-like metal-dependent hydrolase (beta-lactamase superfamily II)
MLNGRTARALLPLLAPTLLSHFATAQQDNVVIESERLAAKVHVLYGRGGNMLLFAGEERTFLVDDQLEPLSEKIQAQIATITPRPVDFVLNTHYHGDHTGGNENFGRSGAVIFSHDHTRELMQEARFNVVFDTEGEVAKPEDLPIVTFSEDMHFHIDGVDIEVFHIPRAHTSGDAVVRLPSLDIIHMGDVFFNGLYPYVDISAGGRVSGVLAACEALLATAEDETKIVPGHGKATDRAGLGFYVEMLKEFQAKAQQALAAEESLETFVAKKISAAYDDPWAESWLTGDQISKIVYLSEQADLHDARSLDGERGFGID